MPFVYQSTELAEQNVETYTALLVAVNKAIEIFPEDEAIKEFYAWLLQLPAYSDDSDSDRCDDSDCADCDPEYDNHDDEEVAKATQYVVTKVLLQDSEQAYIIGERLWVLSGRGLLYLSRDTDAPLSVTVPLWYPHSRPYRIVDCLYWLANACTFKYELAPKVIVAAKGKYPEQELELVSSDGAAPEHLELARKIGQGPFVIELPNNTVIEVRDNGKVFMFERGSNRVTAVPIL